MNKDQEIRIPLTEILVKFRSGNRRPITELDRMVMQAIAAGANSVDSLKPIFQLPERLLVECIVDLMDMALLALEISGNGFRLTEFGTQSLEQGLTTFGERLDDADEITFLREDIAGHIGSWFWYDREKGDFSSQAVQGSIPNGEIDRLLLQKLKKDGKHLHSVGSIVPVRDGISFRVTVDKGSISGLPSQWSHLQPLLLKAEAEKRTGDGYAVPQQRSEEDEDSSWVEIDLHEDDLLLTASAHEEVLRDAISQAQSHLLILSAHVSERMLNTLKEPIVSAIQRGVRVDVLWGLPSLDEGGEFHAKTTQKWLRGIRKSSNDAGNLLTVNEESLNSDAKILVWDTRDGSYQAIVGSYNWLHGLDDSSAEHLGSEVSIRLNDPQLIGNICTTLSGWFDDRGQQLNGVAFRWRNIGLGLAQQEPPNIKQDSPMVRARLLYDENHDEILREGLMYATQRLLVTSHKLNRNATGSVNSSGGKLDWLTHRKSNPEFQFILVTGRNPKIDNWTQEDQDRLQKLVNHVGGSFRLGDGTHARVLVYNDTTVVSSYNFLSTTRDKRQIGVMLKGATIANTLWDVFKAEGVPPA